MELRRAQAEDQQLGHLEFLALLLDDEIDRRQSKMLAERLHRARFEEEKTLEEFDWSFNPQIPADQLGNLATCGFVARYESVLLCGPPGRAPCRRCGHLLEVRRTPKLVCSQCKHELARRRGQRATS